MVLASAISTILPRYITATRSLTCCTTASVVRDEDVREAELPLQILEQVDDLRLDGDVEGGHGLVADDQLGMQRERPSHTDTLPLPTGELRGKAVEVFGIQADDLHQLLHPALAFRAGGDVVDGEGVADDRADAAARVQ